MEKLCIKFKNDKDNKEYEIRDIISYYTDSSFNKEKYLNRLVNICNTSNIYSVLFEPRLKGNPYSINDAISFYDYAYNGWINNTNYVFGIFDSNNEQIASIEVKSNNLQLSEIGYWSSIKGIMTKALKIIINHSKKNNYLSLFARVRIDNNASLKVLSNNGFKNKGLSENEKDGIERFILSREI